MNGTTPDLPCETSITVEALISNPIRVPALHDVPSAPGAARWQGLPPLTESPGMTAAEGAFADARAKAGCRNDANIPRMHNSASREPDRLFSRLGVPHLELIGHPYIRAFCSSVPRQASHLCVMLGFTPFITLAIPNNALNPDLCQQHETVI